MLYRFARTRPFGPGLAQPREKKDRSLGGVASKKDRKEACPQSNHRHSTLSWKPTRHHTIHNHSYRGLPGLGSAVAWLPCCSFYLSSLPPAIVAMPGVILAPPPPSSQTRLARASTATQPLSVPSNNNKPRGTGHHHGHRHSSSPSDHYSGSPGHGGMGSLIRLAQVMFEHWQNKNAPSSYSSSALPSTPPKTMGGGGTRIPPGSAGRVGAGGGERKKKSVLGAAGASEGGGGRGAGKKALGPALPPRPRSKSEGHTPVPSTAAAAAAAAAASS